MRKPSSLSSILSLLLLLTSLSFAQEQPKQDWSKQQARPVVEWARDGVVYEIFQRVFSGQGGFNGITARLDELKKTGVDVLWLMPLNPIGQEKKKGTIGSPYAVRDYYGVNPAYGTPADLKRLVREAHARNMKVIVDVVYNHTSWDNPLLTKHPEWYHKGKDGKPTYPFDWTDIAWLDYSNPALRAYIIDVMKHWVREYDIDGFRCDVAHQVPVDFWEQARVAVDQVKPGLFWLAEAHIPSYMVKAFDADYSWPLLHAINKVFWGEEPATALREEWETERKTFPQGTVHLRIADNHDESRLVVRVGEKAALAAQAFVFTIDGIPLVYNGQEVGDTAESGAPALFERVPITWNIAERRPHHPRFFRQMIALRKASTALRRGTLEWVNNSEEKSVLSFVRRAGGEEVLVVINTAGATVSTILPSIVPDGWTDVTPDLKNDVGKPKPAPTAAAFHLEPWGFRILRRTAKAAERVARASPPARQGECSAGVPPARQGECSAGVPPAKRKVGV